MSAVEVKNAHVNPHTSEVTDLPQSMLVGKKVEFTIIIIHYCETSPEVKIVHRGYRGK